VPRPSPEDLAEALARLPVQVQEVRCRTGPVALDDYPGGRRPSTLVTVSGGGHTGYGENVAFTEAEQRAFAARAGDLVVSGDGAVGGRVSARAEPFARAALESALVDLALRQGGRGLAALTGVEVAPLRWVSSFGALARPGARLRALRAAGRTEGLKLDVDPGWSEEDLQALRADGGVVILDFKERGGAALCARLAACLPDALFEDPPAPCAPARVARDRPLRTVAAVEAAACRDEAINLKAPRMGGPLALLRALGAARRRGALIYFGGMFEVGPGRAQARQLAALFCGEAPNDLGPLSGAMAPPQGPSRVRLAPVGFGATCDWRALLTSFG
jgi:L-alanine-DL-glutamate epimerase-like enolase superfamily enzyme